MTVSSSLFSISSVVAEVPHENFVAGLQALDVLTKCAGTALNSKLISSQKDLFAPMVVEAVSNLDQQLLDLSLVRQRRARSRFYEMYWFKSEE